jgi:hypothetical protein
VEAGKVGFEASFVLVSVPKSVHEFEIWQHLHGVTESSGLWSGQRLAMFDQPQ